MSANHPPDDGDTTVPFETPFSVDKGGWKIQMSGDHSLWLVAFIPHLQISCFILFFTSFPAIILSISTTSFHFLLPDISLEMLPFRYTYFISPGFPPSELEASHFPQSPSPWLLWNCNWTTAPWFASRLLSCATMPFWSAWPPIVPIVKMPNLRCLFPLLGCQTLLEKKPQNRESGSQPTFRR